MVTKVKELLPASLESIIIRLWYTLRPIIKVALLGRKRYCPVCNSWTRGFLSYGPSSRYRKDVVCPVCLSHERHRLAWVFITTSTDLCSGVPKKLLHCAPEPEFERKLKKMAWIQYLSTDLVSTHVMENMDITNIQQSDASFDIILCSHVLEHISDDRKAMAELFRVLKPGGWALIQVPISGELTFEVPAATDPLERERLFGQSDHVRKYGLDIKGRLVQAGFDVKLIYKKDIFEPWGDKRPCAYAISPLFYCRKQA